MAANPPADARSIGDVNASADPGARGWPFLLFRDRDGRPQHFYFEPGLSSATVGRVPSSNLVLDWDRQVSRSHARFERQADGWDVVDDGPSANGTFVNEERVRGRRRLADGDVLRFGTTRAEFHSPRQEAPRGAAASRAPAATLSTTQRRVLVALCRPYKGQPRFAVPANDEQIAEELVLSIREVRGHLTVLCAKLGIDELQSDPRVQLAELAFSTGLITDGDL